MGAYPLWPGFFGGIDGYIDTFYDRHKANENVSKGNYWAKDLEKIHSPEEKYYDTFIAGLENNPRARKFAPKGGWTANANDVRFQLADLTEHYSLLRQKKMLHDMKVDGFYQYYKFAIYAAIGGCSNIDSFLPGELNNQHEAKLKLSYRKLIEDTKRITKEEGEQRRELFFSQINVDPKKYLVAAESVSSKSG